MALAFGSASSGNVDGTQITFSHLIGTSSNTGLTLAQTGADDSAVGTLTWSNPGNIVSDNGTPATVTANNTATSHYLKATNFGFAIPSDATIVGIVARFNKYRSGGTTGNIRDSVVKIIKADGSIGTTNKGATGTNWSTTTSTVVDYGSSTDLWGETWTPADINDADFGVAMTITAPTTSNRVANVDAVWINVYYTQPAAAQTTLFVAVGLSDDTSSVSSVTYNGDALTFERADEGEGKRVEWWYRNAPDAGTNNVVVNISAAQNAVAGAVSLSGVDQTDPIEAGNAASAPNTTAHSVDVTTLSDNAWVMDIMAIANTNSTYTEGAGQTERVQQDGLDSLDMAMSTEGPKTPAGSVTMSWTTNEEGAVNSAIAIKPHVAATSQTKTFTVDGIVASRNTSTFTVDGIVKAQQTKTFTIDGIVKATDTETFTVDGIIKEVFTKTFTVDGLVKAQQTSTFTVDGLVKATLTNTFTVDGIVKAQQISTFTIDGIVKEVFTKTFTVDGIVLAQTTNTFTVDGIVKATQTATFTVDGIVKEQRSVTFTVDGIVLAVQSSTFTVDGLVKATQTKTFTIDAIVLAQQTNTFTVDGIVKEIFTKTFTIDGIIKATQTSTFTIDAIVKETFTKTFTIDGIILQVQSNTFTVDGIVKQIATSAFTVDGIVLEVRSVTFTIDGIVVVSQTNTFTIDGIVKQIATSTFTIDGIVLAVQTKTFTVDGIILETFTKTFTIDAIVKGIFTSQFTIDGIVKVIQSATFTVDGIVVDRLTSTYTIDGIVKGVQTVTFEIDGVIDATVRSVLGTTEDQFAFQPEMRDAEDSVILYDEIGDKFGI